MIHPVTWLAWLAATLLALSITRNPIYVVLVLFCMAVVAVTLRPVSKAPPLPMSLWRMAVLIVLFSALFNGLTAHFGQTVLLHLPAAWPLIGGPITLEALVFGAINGLILAGFLAAFTVLNMALPTHALIRLVPRAFSPLAIVISIAVAFVPTTLRQFQDIRQAQLVRGHRAHGLRDWLPLLMPLFVSGLERAFQLAEAMTARGFANADEQVSPSRSRRQLAIRLLLATGLLVVLVGMFLRLLGPQATVGVALAGLGGAAVVAALALLGRQVPRTTYRPQPWTARDGLVLAGALVVAILYLFPLPGIDRQVLFYSPYPRISLPYLDLMLALGTLGLLMPAVVLLSATRTQLSPAVPAGKP